MISNHSLTYPQTLIFLRFVLAAFGIKVDVYILRHLLLRPLQRRGSFADCWSVAESARALALHLNFLLSL